MIYANVSELNSYAKLSPEVLKLINDFIATVTPDSESGRRKLDGDMVMADINFYQSTPVAKGRIENHKRYIDIQLVISGHESIYISSCEELELEEDKYATNDIAFYTPNLDISYVIPMKAGDFMIIMPDEGHMPGRGEDACDICKIVFKIDKSLWNC